MVDICEDLAPILRILGIVLKLIQYGVPIILIFMGVLDFAKAVTEKDENSVKGAEKKLINRAIAAACVFFVVTIVGVLMKLVGGEDYQECMTCINHPFKATGENACSANKK